VLRSRETLRKAELEEVMKIVASTAPDIVEKLQSMTTVMARPYGVARR